MATENRFKMSQERLDALKKELLYLETDKAKEVAEQIKKRAASETFPKTANTTRRRPSRASSIPELPSSRALLRMPRSSRRSIPACAREQSPSAAESRFATLMMATKRITQLSARRRQTPWKGAYPTIRPLDAASMVTSQVKKITVDAPAGELHFEILSVENG